MKYILKNTRILLYLRVFMISHSYVRKFAYEWESVRESSNTGWARAFFCSGFYFLTARRARRFLQLRPGPGLLVLDAGTLPDPAVGMEHRQTHLS